MLHVISRILASSTATLMLTQMIAHMLEMLESFACLEVSNMSTLYLTDIYLYVLECDENDLRLMNGSDSTEGRLEVCIGGRWGTICDGNWGPPEAAVACKQLNLNSQGLIFCDYEDYMMIYAL